MPNRYDKQNLKAKKCARKLYDEILTKFTGCIIIDDETYVKIDQNQIPGQKLYIADRRLNVADKYKYVKVDKYGRKLLIWQAICSCGLRSRPFVTSGTLNSDLYTKECLEKRLLSFIKRHKQNIKFWPDLASSHYSRKTMNWYRNNHVDVIPKSHNPPNCPEFRPVEKYWAIVKQKMKKVRAVIKSETAMLNQWNIYSGKVSDETVHIMMGGIKKKVRRFLRTGDIF